MTLEEVTQLITAWLPQSKDHYPPLPVWKEEEDDFDDDFGGGGRGGGGEGSPVRYVLKIHFFIESGRKMIQFKTKSKIFIQ